MYIRAFVLSLALVLGAACGGGGGAPAPTPGPGPGPANNEAARLLLEQCGSSALTALADYLALFSAVTDGTATGVAFGGFIPDPLSFDIAIDLDNDMMPDTMATLSFETPAGDPTSPLWTPTEIGDLIANGVSEFPALLSTLDGIVLVMVGSLPGPPAVDGNVRLLYTAGVADTVSGDASVVDGSCQTQLTYTDQPFAGLTATPPTATVGANITDGADALAGDIVMNGTNTASASMSFNAGAPINFTMNLITGAVSFAP